MGSDERDLKLDRRSLEKRFKDVAPLKMARLKTAQAIGDKVDKSQLKEEIENFSEALEEGKMKQLHDLISQGKSAQQIAKMLKLDVKTIQALMDETIQKDSIVSEKVTPYVYNSFNEFVVHHGDKEETDTSTIKERALTKFELKKREKIAKDLPDAEFKKRYGDDWMNVKMGTATNMAKGES